MIAYRKNRNILRHQHIEQSIITYKHQHANVSKISQLKIHMAFPFYTNNNNEHGIKMPDLIRLEKWVRITVKLEPKRQIDQG